jgi:hypothetical protein
VLICPTGSLRKIVSSPIDKNISLFPTGKSSLHARPVPPHKRGASRSSRTLGAGCGGRGSVQTYALACGRRSRVVLMPRRWHQVGGNIRRRRWQESPVTGESTKEAVKTIARGMPGDSGVTVVTNACAFYTTHAAAGAPSARHSLRPLLSESAMLIAELGRIASRGCGSVSGALLRLIRCRGHPSRRGLPAAPQDEDFRCA